MATAMERWTEGFDGMRVYTVDYEKYDAKRMERIEAQMAKMRATSEVPEPPTIEREPPDATG
jgi:hypothetical protein